MGGQKSLNSERYLIWKEKSCYQMEFLASGIFGRGQEK